MTSRRVLITGASKGIGRSVAERLAATGHRPMGIARRAPADFPGEFHVADLADREATAAALEAVVSGGTVDAVVNNVGLVALALLGSIDLDLGVPDELAAAICFLLSEDAGFITGQTIRVDGGGSGAA
ncbi:SDR family oxidoreductase [Pseudonocardia benzenivorans]|uniref:SDR family oxidoreductase n=1 Tax=Pseudonocardia benzenivorans TaxID=228005 RepID=A0ABW3VD53_9PSEU|nr:hypothetical protein PSD17_26360 [Pseudonocardia sp. D17]